ncbi:MAG: tetratricopeptide repeat protein [Bacteroidota bacterium]|nr:tetratricopeptide repeat protein [Bacteroidota bacterium]
MHITSRLLIAAYIIILLSWIVSTIYPSHYNWGFHLFAFYPDWYIILCLGLLLLFLLPSVRNHALKIFQRCIHWCSRRSILLIFLLLGGLFAITIYFFPSKLHLLGDGDIILQLTPKDPNIKDVSGNFRDQPLMYFIIRSTQFIIGGGSPVDVDFVYRIIDLISGIIYLALIFIFLHFQKIPKLEKALIGCLLFVGVKLQFFFGYVENYSILTLCITAYMISGWLVFKEQIHSIVPLSCFILMLSFHLGSFIFFPSLFVILYSVWERNKRELAVSAAITIALGIVLYFFTDLNINQIADRIVSVYHHELLPVFGWYYAIFSWLHFLDWINAHGLIMPFALIGSIIILLSKNNKPRLKDNLALFLIISTACGFAFTLVISPALGMARDWDLIATFFIPQGFLFIFFVIGYLSLPEARQIVLMIIVMLIIQNVTWIGINADENRHLRRAEMLTNPKLSGTIPKVYYESLAKIYWRKNDYTQSSRWYERYLTIDSSNPRILANLAEVYKRLGEHEKAFEVLKQSASASNDPGVLLNLGVEFLKRNDTTSAVNMFEGALNLDTTFAHAHANLAIIYHSRRLNNLVIHHATKAITYGLPEPAIYMLLGNAYSAIDDIDMAVKYYEMYLERKPNDTRIVSLRNKLRYSLSGQR